MRKSKKKFFITDNESKSIGTCNSIQTKSESRKKSISLNHMNAQKNPLVFLSDIGIIGQRRHGTPSPYFMGKIFLIHPMYKGHALLCIFNVFITYLGKKKTLKDIAETFVLRKSKKKFFITDNESKSTRT